MRSDFQFSTVILKGEALKNPVNVLMLLDPSAFGVRMTRKWIIPYQFPCLRFRGNGTGNGSSRPFRHSPYPSSSKCKGLLPGGR